jgi:acetolactate synthase-1/2/3 large subunit
MAKTLLLIGHGAVDFKEEIIYLIETYNINVVYSMNAKGIVSDNHPLNLGMIGWKGNSFANERLKECEHLIVLGSRLDVRQIPDADILKPFNKKVTIIDTNYDYLSQIKNNVLTFNEVFGEISDWIADYKTDNIHPEDSINSILEYLSTEMSIYSVVTDVGENQLRVCNNWSVDHQDKFITSGGLGTMGYAIPGAIGAGIKDRKVIGIMGDGGFQMNYQELELINYYKLNNVKFIVINNHQLKLVADFEKESKITSTLTIDDYSCPNIEKICDVYNIRYTTSVEEFIDSDTCVLLEMFC